MRQSAAVLRGLPKAHVTLLDVDCAMLDEVRAAGTGKRGS
jgi:hypothetical protein